MRQQLSKPDYNVANFYHADGAQRSAAKQQSSSNQTPAKQQPSLNSEYIFTCWSSVNKF